MAESPIKWYHIVAGLVVAVGYAVLSGDHSVVGFLRP